MLSRREVLAGLTATAVIGSGGCSILGSSSSAPTWPTLRDGANNRGRARATVPPSAPTDSWERDIGQLPSGAVRHGDRLYCGSAPDTEDGRVYALGAESGEVAWQYDLAAADERVLGTPAVLDDRVIVPLTAHLLALDIEEGTKIWQEEYADPRSPTVVDDRIYFGTRAGERGRIHCIKGNGKGSWREAVESAVLCAPAVADGTVYVADGDDALYALDAEDGTQRWRRPIAGSWFGAPVVADDEIYVVDRTGVVHSFDSAGEKRWTRSISDRTLDDPNTENLVTAAPAVTSDGVFVAGLQDPLYALERTDGSVRWKVSDDGFHNSGPIAVEDAVYFPGRGIRAVDQATGETRWRTDHDENLRMPVPTDGGVIASKWAESTIVHISE